MVLMAKICRCKNATDLMAKVWLKVIIQIKTPGDDLSMIWLQVASSENGHFGGSGHIAIATTIMTVIYISNLFLSSTTWCMF